MSEKIQPEQELPEDVQELFEKHLKYLNAGKANYAKADKALDEILRRCDVGVQHLIPGSAKKPPLELTLIDQFADKNAVWSGSSCKRFKISTQTVKAQDQ